MVQPGLSGPVDRKSDVPLGAQLARRLRDQVARGGLGPGEKLPSIRDLAAAAGVNVNTVRAVYGRLEDEGLVHSEQGRGTFVAGPADDRDARRDLRAQIARLEADLAERRDSWGGELPRPEPVPGGRLLSTDELRGVRDVLRAQLAELDETRAEVARRLEALEAPAAEERTPESGQASSYSLRNVRVRWLPGS